MAISKMFINGCSFLTTRPRDNVTTHAGEQLAKMMGIESFPTAYTSKNEKIGGLEELASWIEQFE